MAGFSIIFASHGHVQTADRPKTPLTALGMIWTYTQRFGYKSDLVPREMRVEQPAARIPFEEMSMNGMNFFTWIRDGVRQSVLLGVSDAIETLGTPASTEDLHPSVAGLLKVDKSGEATPRLSSPKQGGDHSNRKRLGRSLKDLETEAKNG